MPMATKGLKVITQLKLENNSLLLQTKNCLLFTGKAVYKAEWCILSEIMF